MMQSTYQKHILLMVAMSIPTILFGLRPGQYGSINDLNELLENGKITQEELMQRVKAIGIKESEIHVPAVEKLISKADEKLQINLEPVIMGEVSVPSTTSRAPGTRPANTSAAAQKPKQQPTVQTTQAVQPAMQQQQSQQTAQANLLTEDELNKMLQELNATGNKEFSQATARIDGIVANKGSSIDEKLDLLTALEQEEFGKFNKQELLSTKNGLIEELAPKVPASIHIEAKIETIFMEFEKRLNQLEAKYKNVKQQLEAEKKKQQKSVAVQKQEPQQKMPTQPTTQQPTEQKAQPVQPATEQQVQPSQHIKTSTKEDEIFQKIEPETKKRLLPIGQALLSISDSMNTLSQSSGSNDEKYKKLIEFDRERVNYNRQAIEYRSNLVKDLKKQLSTVNWEEKVDPLFEDVGKLNKKLIRQYTTLEQQLMPQKNKIPQQEKDKGPTSTGIKQSQTVVTQQPTEQKAQPVQPVQAVVPAGVTKPGVLTADQENLVARYVDSGKGRNIDVLYADLGKRVGILLRGVKIPGLPGPITHNIPEAVDHKLRDVTTPKQYEAVLKRQLWDSLSTLPVNEQTLSDSYAEQAGEEKEIIYRYYMAKALYARAKDAKTIKDRTLVHDITDQLLTVYLKKMYQGKTYAEVIEQFEKANKFRQELGAAS